MKPSLSSQNQVEKLLVIASYPPKGHTHHQSIVGGASYTKNTLLHLFQAAKNEQKNLEITVLGETLSTNENEYTDESIIVKRIWTRSSFLSMIRLTHIILRDYKDTKKILVAFELAMFGNMLCLLPLPFMLLLLRLQGKNVTLILHQVIDNMSELDGHLGIKKSVLRSTILNFLLKTFYFLFLNVASQIIVFETIFKQRLVKYIPAKKLIVIPHGVETFTPSTTRAHARQQLGIKQHETVLLHFGFLAWYKGTDWLTTTWNAQKMEEKHISLFLAGGPNPNRLSLPFYTSYLQDIEANAKEKHIRLTGFIPEDEIALYFIASDIVLFPYRTLMSSSGPLSICLSFKKPFLLADTMKDITLTDDFQESLQHVQLQSKDIQFSLADTSWDTILQQIEKPEWRIQMEALCASLASKRSWEQIGHAYYTILFPVL